MGKREAVNKMCYQVTCQTIAAGQTQPCKAHADTSSISPYRIRLKSSSMHPTGIKLHTLHSLYLGTISHNRRKRKNKKQKNKKETESLAKNSRRTGLNGTGNHSKRPSAPLPCPSHVTAFPCCHHTAVSALKCKTQQQQQQQP